jgi:hypothetical protein
MNGKVAIILLALIALGVGFISYTKIAIPKGEPYFCQEIRNTMYDYMLARRTLDCTKLKWLRFI